VDAAWVSPGLEVVLDVDPADALAETDEGNNSQRLTPVVGAGIVLPVTAVPIVHDGTTGTVPAFEQPLFRTWPVKGSDRQTRAPLTFSGTLSPSGSEAWEDLLETVSAARTADGSSRYYYGFVRPGYGSGIFGVGYVGRGVATGADSSVSTYLHELGHNLGRPHAPCGSAGQTDPNYPYAGGKLGSYGYDLGSSRLVNPGSTYDLMSYCRPEWVSDYNYGKVQAFLESRAPASAAGGSSPMLLFSGRVQEKSAQLSPVQRFFGSPSIPSEHGAELRLLDASGQVHSVRVELWRTADLAADGQHFSVAYPDVGTLASVELWYGGRLLAQRAQPAVGAPSEVGMKEEAGVLQLRWDAKRHPWVAVVHVDPEAGNTTLAVWLEGGVAAVPLTGLPSGGRFDVSFSDGLNATLVSLQRR
jgi:hypothetical protein